MRGNTSETSTFPSNTAVAMITRTNEARNTIASTNFAMFQRFASHEKIELIAIHPPLAKIALAQGCLELGQGSFDSLGFKRAIPPSPQTDSSSILGPYML